MKSEERTDARSDRGFDFNLGTLRIYIGGEWVDSESGETFPAHSPATGDEIARVPLGTRRDAQRAIEAARGAASTMRHMTAWERSELCVSVADVISRRADELALVLTMDQGKALGEARGEVSIAEMGFREAAELVKWLEGSSIPLQDPNKRAFSLRQPRGVYAVITPWNFPINIPVEYLAPGLATGNSIVWVPAPSTAACAVKLMECLDEAGVPSGAVNLVTGEGPTVGDEIVHSPLTDAVGFTGSSATGETIARQAAGKPLLLELGGNGPTLVFEDANLETAAEQIAFGCFFNAGQCCSATELILAQAPVAQDLSELLVEKARDIKVGFPLDPATQMGPLNNEKTAEKMDRHVRDAADNGARVLMGGERMPQLGSPLYYSPTVIANLAADSDFAMEESFGPVAPVLSFETEEEALEIADRSSLGLVSSVWTSKMGRAMRCAEELKAGIVNINEHSNYWEIHVPFGGASGKRSGVGRLGGKHTMMEMTDLKTVTFDVTRT